MVGVHLPPIPSPPIAPPGELGPLVSPIFPVSRFSLQVGNGNNNDGAFCDAVENAVGESIHQTTPDFFIDKRLELRIADDKVEGLIEFIKKFVAEPDGLLFIPGKSVVKIGLRSRQKGIFIACRDDTWP